MNIIQQLAIQVYKVTKKFVDFTGIKTPNSLKVINKKVLKGLRSNSINLNGDTLYLDEADSLLLSINGVYEPYETELVHKMVKAGDIVLDIGANIGYYTIQFAKLVGEKGKVYAFEPDPLNFALLKKNIEANSYTNVILVNKAVSSSNGTLELFINEENRGDNRLYNSADGREAVSVDTITLDAYFSEPIKIDFIKIDIQGAENEALQGMKNLLSSQSEVTLITEFWPIGIHRAGGEAKDYLTLLSQNQFDISEILESKKSTVPVQDVSSLITAYTVENELYTNLLCVKSN